MAATTDAKRSAAGGADAAITHIRDLNDRILANASRRGAASLEAYERLLENVANFQETAGERGGEWVTSMGRAQAAFTRELAKSYPAAARRVGERVSEVARGGARRAREVPGVATAEGETRGAVSR